MSIDDVLGHSWAQISESYPARLGEVEGMVRRWALAPEDADWHSPYPLWAAREGNQPSRRELEAPEKAEGWDNVVQYGLDDDGRVVIARWFRVILGQPRVDREAIWTSIGGRPTYLHRNYPPAANVLVSCVVPLHDDGRLRAVEAWYDDGGHSVETYGYDGGRLTQIERGDARYDVAYDDNGELLTITYRHPMHRKGQPEIVFRRKRPGDVARAQREAIELIAKGVVEWVRRQSLAAPARVLLLGYSLLPNDPLPPALALGMVGDVTARDVASGELDPEWLFALAEQPVLDPQPNELLSPATLEPMSILNQEWRSTSDPEAARKFMVSVAKRLAREDWNSILGPAAPEFAVVAVDPGREDLRKNLRALGISLDVLAPGDG